MNVAAGLAGNGDVGVICSGWERKPGQSDGKIIPVWVSRSADGGKTWALIKSFPEPEPGWTHFVPFGPILAGDQLDVVRRVADIYERKNGLMEFIVIESTVSHAERGLLGRSRQVVLVRNPKPAVAA
mgnify:CR=1 FL=1